MPRVADGAYAYYKYEAGTGVAWRSSARLVRLPLRNAYEAIGDASVAEQRAL